MDISAYECDVIVIAGQSNAEGNGVRPEGVIPAYPRDTYEVIDSNPSYPYFDEKCGCTMLKVSLPTVCEVRQVQDRVHNGTFRADYGRSFAADYIAAGMLEKGRKILLVKAAVGGTGFSNCQWGVDNPLSARAEQMIKYALGLNEGNKVKAILWHQGEHDSVSSPLFSVEDRYDFYRIKYGEQIRHLRKLCGDVPVICGGFVDDWADRAEHKTASDAVEKALADVSASLGKSAFVSSDGLKSNDQTVGDGDIVHFGYYSVLELGDRYFAAYEKIVKAKK